MAAHQSTNARQLRRRSSASSLWRQAWPRTRQILFVAFTSAVLGLIAWRAREIDWTAVLAALRALPLRTVALASVIALAAHVAYISYDVLARRYTGHRLGLGRTIAVAGVSFAFNLNLGALVGGIALRYRLYSRFGLAAPAITRVVGFSLLTNWIGYAALAGASFASGLVEWPGATPMSGIALRALGIALLLVVASYLAACRWSRRRNLTVRGHSIELPRARTAALQVSAVAGVITHVPAGLGVLEAVFVSLLSDAHPVNELLAALLAYRAVFYLGPLLIAAVAYVALELAARRRHPPALATSVRAR